MELSHKNTYMPKLVAPFPDQRTKYLRTMICMRHFRWTKHLSVSGYYNFSRFNNRKFGQYHFGPYNVSWRRGGQYSPTQIYLHKIIRSMLSRGSLPAEKVISSSNIVSWPFFQFYLSKYFELILHVKHYDQLLYCLLGARKIWR